MRAFYHYSLFKSECTMYKQNYKERIYTPEEEIMNNYDYNKRGATLGQAIDLLEQVIELWNRASAYKRGQLELAVESTVKTIESLYDVTITIYKTDTGAIDTDRLTVWDNE